MDFLRRLKTWLDRHLPDIALLLAIGILSLIVTFVCLHARPTPFISPLALSPLVRPPTPTQPSGAGPPPDPEGLNLSFEGGYSTSHTAIQISPSGLRHVSYRENNQPSSWTTFYYEGEACPGNLDFLLGRPEVKLTSYQGRTYDGDAAAFLFTTYRCHKAGLLQQISVTPGSTIRATCYAHFWYAGCSSHADSPCPLDYDCSTCLTWTKAVAKIGIDPTGGIDPRSENITWSSPQSQYGTYSSRPLTVYAKIPLTSTTATFLIYDHTEDPLHHCDFYVDACTWSEVTLYYYPFLLEEWEE